LVVNGALKWVMEVGAATVGTSTIGGDKDWGVREGVEGVRVFGNPA